MKQTGTRFEKWEGLGNDFVLLTDAGDLDDETVRRLCDRRRGVGADGVLLVSTGGARPRMIVRNADGSRPEMCGNGLRCVAAHLAERDLGGELVIDTDAGPKRCAVRGEPGQVEVEIEMGTARRGPATATSSAPATTASSRRSAATAPS